MKRRRAVELPDEGLLTTESSSLKKRMTMSICRICADGKTCSQEAMKYFPQIATKVNFFRCIGV